ncbi:MAG: NAD(P)/FAD-dependent oxidoreductase [Acidimicrobiia bacterium]
MTADLSADGAPTGDFLDDVRMYLSGHRLRGKPTGLVAVSASRTLLETHLRSRVTSLANVRVLAPCDVVGPLADGTAVAGVRLRGRLDGAEETLTADVVVDATGRGSRAGAWLEEAGMEAVAEDRMPIDVAYATRRYRLGRASLGNDLAVLHGLTPQHPRGGVLAVIEGDQAMLTLAGVLGDRPPTDPDGFSAFARSLAFPDIADAIAGAEPFDEPVAHRFPASVWRHYERLQWLPRGFAVVGDAVCSLNPIYGQGMSVAALEAVALRRHLQRHRALHPQRFQREVARVVAPVWQMAVGGDVMFAGFDGQRTTGQRFLGAYIRRLHAAAARDAGLARRFARVSGLVDSPSRLLRPTVAVRVLLAR